MNDYISTSSPSGCQQQRELSIHCHLKLLFVRARASVGFSHARVHELKHTFGRRL